MAATNASPVASAPIADSTRDGGILDRQQQVVADRVGDVGVQAAHLPGVEPVRVCSTSSTTS